MVFWFTSSIAWAVAVTGLRKATNQDGVFNHYVACKANEIMQCESFDSASYGGAVVAVVSVPVYVF